MALTHCLPSVGVHAGILGRAGPGAADVVVAGHRIPERREPVELSARVVKFIWIVGAIEREVAWVDDDVWRRIFEVADDGVPVGQGLRCGE